MTEQLKKKVDFAIKLLQSIPTDEGPVELSYSGGKDSDVILELAKMAGIPYRAIYKNTTIDRPGTIRHCKDNGVEIIQPKKRFFQIIEECGIPSRWMRFCCRFLKEYKVLDRAIQGIRRCESSKRTNRYKEPEVCRTYRDGYKSRIYLPILEWTNNDVVEFIKERGIKCHPYYYDEKGNFHVERRVGCIGCPMVSDNGIAQFKQYPKMLKLWIKAQQKFLDTHPNVKTAQKHQNAYECMFDKLFCKTFEEFKNFTGGGLFADQAIDCKEFLEDYFGIDLTL